MASNEQSVKINKNEKFIEKAEVGSGDKKYDIEIKEDNQEVTFEKLEDGKESKNTINIRFREDGTTEWKSAKVRIVYHESFWRKGFTLPKKIKEEGGSAEIELKDASKRLSTDHHTYTLGTYGVLFAFIIAIVAFGWWWVSSSKKEDKEEESL